MHNMQVFWSIHTCMNAARDAAARHPSVCRFLSRKPPNHRGWVSISVPLCMHVCVFSFQMLHAHWQQLSQICCLIFRYWTLEQPGKSFYDCVLETGHTNMCMYALIRAHANIRAHAYICFLHILGCMCLQADTHIHVVFACHMCTSGTCFDTCVSRHKFQQYSVLPNWVCMHGFRTTCTWIWATGVVQGIKLVYMCVFIRLWKAPATFHTRKIV